MSNTEESVLSATVVCGIFETDDWWSDEQH